MFPFAPRRLQTLTRAHVGSEANLQTQQQMLAMTDIALDF